VDLTKLEVSIRPRNPWEGVDLGFALAREWFRPLWVLWCATALPLSLLIWALLPWGLAWTMFAIWWFKPLYEPPLLYWASRALFGERLGLWEVLRRWFRLQHPAWIPNLLWRRLDPNRSFHYPVTLLEGLRGRERKERLRVLDRKQQAATWLTILGIHFESALEISGILLIWMLVPGELPWLDLESLMFQHHALEEGLWAIATLLTMSLIAPFYVMGGFALYLTRRIELEAWDIELSFRRMAVAPSPRSRPSQRLALWLALPLLLGLIAPPPLPADVGPKEARALIAEVLEHEDFGQKQSYSTWEYRDPSEPQPPSSSLLDWLNQFFDNSLSAALAGGLRVLLGLGIGVLVLFAALWLYRHRSWLSPAKDSALAPDKARFQLFGLDLRPSSLPDDIPGAALARLQAGETRAALSLLYRGTLSRLVAAGKIEIPSSATENECLRQVAQAYPEAVADYFHRLTRIWVLSAYAQARPQETEVETLCRHWRTVFGQAQTQ